MFKPSEKNVLNELFCLVTKTLCSNVSRSDLMAWFMFCSGYSEWMGWTGEESERKRADGSQSVPQSLSSTWHRPNRGPAGRKRVQTLFPLLPQGKLTKPVIFIRLKEHTHLHVLLHYCLILVKSLFFAFSFLQDFADITSEPSLDQPIIIEDDDEADMKAESSETSSFLLVSNMSRVVQVHQRLCLSFARSLWYHSEPPISQARDHISALVSSYQITAPLIARFYHLMGTKALFYAYQSNNTGSRTSLLI